MKLELKMTLESDAIFGNGMSTPGGEDISVQFDEQGFPYYKGSTFKGVFREEYARYLEWTDKKEDIDRMFGIAGSDEQEGKIVFSDFVLSENVRNQVVQEFENNFVEISECLTNTRTFTKVEDGSAKDGSLRTARCINKGLVFYSTLDCEEQDASTIREVLGLVKWIGTMRNRGFGKVKIEVVE